MKKNCQEWSGDEASIHMGKALCLTAGYMLHSQGTEETCVDLESKILYQAQMQLSRRYVVDRAILSAAVYQLNYM